MKRLDEALASFAAAIRLFPAYSEAHNNSGIVLKEAERLEEALRKLTDAGYAVTQATGEVEAIAILRERERIAAQMGTAGLPGDAGTVQPSLASYAARPILERIVEIFRFGHR